MRKEDTEEEKIKKQMLRFLLYLHKGERTTIRNMCAPGVLWKYGHSYSRGEYSTLAMDLLCRGSEGQQLRLVSLRVVVRRLDACNFVVTGTYRLESRRKDDGQGEDCFDYTAVVTGGRVGFLQLNESRRPARIHKVVTIHEEVYYFDEAQVSYIESIRDHIVWHCGAKTVESVGTLKRLEDALSADFVRVHRSYIVNRAQVFHIQRCSVTMADGASIPIPYKKYVQMRERLTEDP